MESLNTIFQDAIEKHTDNGQITQLLIDLKGQMTTILKEQLLLHQNNALTPNPASLKHYAHHCLRPEVINNLSHKVKTPLTAIISGIQLLYNYDHEDCVMRILDYLIQSSIELTQFVNDIMDLYYITQDKFDIEYEPLNLSKLIEYVYSVYALQMQEESINFHYTIDKQIPETIITDKKRLTQILINLFSNAIKSFDYDQENKQIQLTFVPLNANRLQLSICDTGRGVDLQTAESLFDPFYKTGNTDGIGLGLTICRLLIKKIGNGTIQFIKPTNNEFTTELIAEYNINTHDTHIKPQKKSHILSKYIKEPILVIIDDNTTNLDLLKIIVKNIIEKNGYMAEYAKANNGQILKIKTFNDPQTAKTFILENMSQIVLCMIDMKMPKLTGIELIQAIYNITNNDIPFSFVIMSALTRTYISEAISGLPMNIQSNIVISSKPYNMTELETYIITAVKGKVKRESIV